MAITYGWQFSKDFGFSGSAAGRHDARNHPEGADDNEYGDGSYVEDPPKLAKESAKGGPIRRAQGGPAQEWPGADDGAVQDTATDTPGVRERRQTIQRLPNKTMGREVRPYGSGMDTDPRATAATNAVDSGNYARGGRATGRPSTEHAGNDPKGYQFGGPAANAPPTAAPGVAMPAGMAPPGPAPMAGPMQPGQPPMRGPAPSPLAQGGGGGGPLANATMTMPVHDAARLAHGLVQAGRVGGIQQAIGNAAAARGAAQARMAAMAPGAAGSPAAAPPQPPAQRGIPAMRRGGRFATGGSADDDGRDMDDKYGVQVTSPDPATQQRVRMGNTALGIDETVRAHQRGPIGDNGMDEVYPDSGWGRARKAANMEAAPHAKGGHITAAQRHRLPASEFGLPAKEGYPIDTPGRARSALSRASANASPAEQATIRRKVHARYPSIGKK